MIVADLHLHSPFARAVSPRMSLTGMVEMAKQKGITLLATGDWTHPIWFEKLEQELAEVRPGIFKLKPEYQSKTEFKYSTVEPLFLLSTEISCVFTQGGKGRRVHILIMVSSFDAARAVIKELLVRGANLGYDGRPIIGMSCHDLAELVFEIDEQSLIIPAHAWTPWFGILGSKGGFNSLHEAYGDLTDQIFAIETGLSSDPAMNWKIPFLDDVAIVSFSDAHSPEKLGRELTIFTEKKADSYTFQDLRAAIAERKLGKNKGLLKLISTTEFYPQEGKYHWDGHREHHLVQSPEVTRKNGITCLVCGKPLTVGVEFRVDELSAEDRLDSQSLIIDQKNKNQLIEHFNALDKNRQPYTNLVPLNETIAESLHKKVGTKIVTETYHDLVTQIGSEWQIMVEFSEPQLRAKLGDQLATAILQVRQGELTIEPGYDGEYGKVTLKPVEKIKVEQTKLF